MRDVKPIIAKNLAYFRREAGLTQAELAEKLNYSDKAVSRWEHGDTLPDINVLYHLCEFYGIDMSILAREDADTVTAAAAAEKENRRSGIVYRLCLFGLSVAAVWLVATILFLYSGAIGQSSYWMAFIWALPASCVTLRLFSRGAAYATLRFVVNSILVWTLITAVFLHFILQGYVLWPLYLVGIPLQAILILWYRLKRL